MAIITIHVAWSSISKKSFEVDNEQDIGEIVGQIKDRLGLPDKDPRGEQIEYGFYIMKDGHPEPFRRPKFKSVSNGTELRFANRKAPWWIGTGPLPPNPPIVPLNPSGLPQVPTGLGHCRIVISPNCSIDVPAEGLRINRDLLITRLQTSESSKIIFEKVKVFTGFRSQLNAVSRDHHCTMYRQGDQWLLRANQPTYVFGREINRGTTVAITQTTKVILGRAGWPIEIHILPI